MIFFFNFIKGLGVITAQAKPVIVVVTSTCFVIFEIKNKKCKKEFHWSAIYVIKKKQFLIKSCHPNLCVKA